MPLRPCLGCGRITNGSRCPTCQLPTRHTPKAPHSQRRPDFTWAERQRRAKTVAAWRAENGDICPGYRTPPHPSADLTADHITPVAAGGAEDGPLAVLCRTCNGRKASRSA